MSTQIIRWTNGGFGMAAHNYDGDMLTDEVAQVHRSPGFITSNLIGKNEDGTLIKGECCLGFCLFVWVSLVPACFTCGVSTARERVC